MQVSYEKQLINVNKIVCVGRNYVDHIAELKNEIPESMVVFMKPSSAISKILNSKHLDEEIHYESEICFLVKDGLFKAVGFGLDLTKRDLQSKLKAKSLPWERAKCFDGAALFSSFVSIEKGDIKSLHVRLYIDDELIQDGCVEQMIYKPEVIFEEVESFSKLYDNDIVMSGTPKGVGVVKAGSKFRGQILLKEQVLIEAGWIAK